MVRTRQRRSRGPLCHGEDMVAEQSGGPLCHGEGTVVEQGFPLPRQRWAGIAEHPRGLLFLWNLRRL